MLFFHLQLIYERFYSTASASDKCTLFSDRNVINQRNVKADAHDAYAPNKQMFLLAVKARIIACAMKTLGMEKIDSRPTSYIYPEDKSRSDRTAQRVYIKNLAVQIVGKFIVDEKSYNRVLQHVLAERRNEQACRSQVTIDGRFPFRKSGCNKTFRFTLKAASKKYMASSFIIFYNACILVS